MNKKELNEKLDALKDEYNKKEMELYNQYALDNCPVKIGDLVADSFHMIMVEKMTPYVGAGFRPMMKFTGHLCKKNGEPLKKDKVEDVYQSNMVEHNGKAYSFSF